MVGSRLRLAWRQGGTGEPLLTLHGFGESRDAFAGLRADLEADYRVLSPDLPAHGDSPPLGARPTVAALTDALIADLDAMGQGRVHVLGVSLGGRVGLELARAGRARSLVAIAPSGLALPWERAYQATMLTASRLTLRPLRPVLGRLAATRPGRTALLATLRSMPWRASRTEALALRSGTADSPDYWRTLLWSILLDVPTGLGDIDCPVLLLQGTADLIASGQTLRYEPLIPRARFRPLLAAGHVPLSDRPRAVLSLLRQTTELARAEPASAAAAS